MMSAHYLICIKEVRGTMLTKMEDDAGLVDDVLVPHSAKYGGIAQHIDPYGTTTFSGVQSAVLLDEVASISISNLDPKHAKLLSDLAALLTRAASEVHLQVTFLGD